MKDQAHFNNTGAVDSITDGQIYLAPDLFKLEVLPAVDEPIALRLLPLDASWRLKFVKAIRPAGNLSETVGDFNVTLRALILEYMFLKKLLNYRNRFSG